MVVPDGSFVLYRNPANTLNKATFAATPVVTSVGANIGALLQITNDSKVALYSTTGLSLGSRRPQRGRHHLGHTESGAGPARHHADGAPRGHHRRQRRARSTSKETPTASFALSTVALTGGKPLLLHASTNSALLAQTGTGVLSLFDETPILHSETATRIDVSYVDAAKGGLPEKPNPSILDAQDVFTITGKTFVYRDIGANPAIYALDMP